MLKDLIIIENGVEVQCDDLESVVKILIDENFYNLSDEEKKEKIRFKALANSLGMKIEIIDDVSTLDIDSLENKFIIQDEITYILSLLTTNKILLLENRKANFFGKNIDKSKIENNYIILNSFAKELLKNYINENR
ncbi:MAG: hypothetical protein J6M60_03665 [Clostridia bacterium]|nr:hypothetical protein [Clostridia bacterium]